MSQTEPRLRDLPVREAAAILFIFAPIITVLALRERLHEWLDRHGVGRENPDVAYARGYRKGVEDERKRDAA